MTQEQVLVRQLELLAAQNQLLTWYVVATIVIAAATALNILQDWFRGLLARVALDIGVGEAVVTPMGQPPVTVAYFARLRVTNRSWWKTARNVEVVLERLSRKGAASGAYASGGNVFGINLEWSHFPGMSLMPQIAAGTSRTVDFGHVVRPTDRSNLAANNDPGIEDKLGADPSKTILKLGTVVHPFNRNHLLEPGEWEIELRLSGTNVKARKITVRATIEGRWYDDPARFAQEGFSYTVN